MYAVDRKPELIFVGLSIGLVLVLADAVAYTLGLLGF